MRPLVLAACMLAAAAPAARAAVTPAESQLLAHGTAVTGPCTDVNQQQNDDEQYSTFHTISPDRTKAAPYKRNEVRATPTFDPFTLPGLPDTRSPIFAGTVVGDGGTSPNCHPVASPAPDAKLAGGGIELNDAGPYTMVTIREVSSWVYTKGSVDPQYCAGNLSTSAGTSPPPDPDPNDSASWHLSSLCITRKDVHFLVRDKQGTCPGSIDGSAVNPGSPYVNQYTAGPVLSLPKGHGDARRGANACGPSSTLMGMLIAKEHAQRPLTLPSLGTVYSHVMHNAPADNAENGFDGGKAVAFLRSKGFRDASYHDLSNDLIGGAFNHSALVGAVAAGPVALSTGFGGAQWGTTGGGHIILLDSIDDDGTSYRVDDPAGNYFQSLTHHYGPGICGYHADYPMPWVEAMAAGRYYVQLGHPSGDPDVLQITDADRGAPGTAKSFWLQAPDGRRVGFVDGNVVNDFGDAGVAFTPAPLPDDTEADDTPVPPQDEWARNVLLTDPPAGTVLHVKPGDDGAYALHVSGWRDGNVFSSDAPAGSGAPGADLLASSPTVATYSPPAAAGGGGQSSGGGGGASGGDQTPAGGSADSTSTPQASGAKTTIAPSRLLTLSHLRLRAHGRRVVVSAIAPGTGRLTLVLRAHGRTLARATIRVRRHRPFTATLKLRRRRRGKATLIASQGALRMQRALRLR